MMSASPHFLDQHSSHTHVERDPERALLFKQCCDLLLAGGYFRARISSLSSFDRVVGGLSWSLSYTATASLDTFSDLLFTENASIGARIKLSDALTRALVQARCPHQLQSHQIQGCDYAALFPVIQWLVRKVLEIRRLTGESTRMQSLKQFRVSQDQVGKLFLNAVHEDEIQRDKVEKEGDIVLYHPLASLWNDTHHRLAAMLSSHVPKRQFKPKPGALFGALDRRVDATLLEFGIKLNRSRMDALSTAEQKDNERDDKRGKVAQAKEKMGALFQSTTVPNNQEEPTDSTHKEDTQRYSELEAQLSDVGSTAKVSGASIGAIVGLQGEEIKRAMERYNENKKKSEEEMEEMVLQGKRGALILHERQVDAIKRHLSEIRAHISAKASIHAASADRVQEVKADIQAQTLYAARCRRELAKLEVQEKDAVNVSSLEHLKTLVEVNEQLTGREETFRVSCMESRTELMAEVEALEARQSDTVNPDMARILQIEKVHETESNKLAKLRALLAKRNQMLARLNRALDERPSRTELLQYEKRFGELSSLIHEKLSETRKYYAMYNTMSDSLQILQAEKTLLDELVAQHSSTGKVKASKTALHDRLSQIVSGLKQQCTNKEALLTSSRSQADALAVKQSQLVDKQRSYARLLRELKEEMELNLRLSHDSKDGEQ